MTDAETFHSGYLVAAFIVGYGILFSYYCFLLMLLRSRTSAPPSASGDQIKTGAEMPHANRSGV